MNPPKGTKPATLGRGDGWRPGGRYRPGVHAGFGASVGLAGAAVGDGILPPEEDAEFAYSTTATKTIMTPITSTMAQNGERLPESIVLADLTAGEPRASKTGGGDPILSPTSTPLLISTAPASVLGRPPSPSPSGVDGLAVALLDSMPPPLDGLLRPAPGESAGGPVRG